MASRRFFCVTCNRVKRVSSLPPIIENEHADSPELRLGLCRRHAKGKNADLMGRHRTTHVNIKRRKSSPQPSAPKTKKTRSSASFKDSDARKNHAA